MSYDRQNDEWSSNPCSNEELLEDEWGLKYPSEIYEITAVRETGK